MLLIPLASFSASDPRLDMRTGDDLIPQADTQYFTRYTPWLKVLHPMSDAEVTSSAHGGEGCQQIRCISISPKNPDLAIFGTDTSGVWITTNGGDLWYNTNRNMIPADIADVMCHPTDENIMLAYSVSTSGSPGIYRSTDKGRSWTSVYKTYIAASGFSGHYSISDNLFAYDSANGYIYAVTGQGVVQSTDSGASWSLIKMSDEYSDDDTANDNTSSNRIHAASIDVSSDGKTIIACYAHTDFSLNGINVGAVNTDGSVTWNKLYISGSTDWKVYSFIIDNDGRYIAGAYDDTNEKYGLYISSDKGQSWTAFASEDGSYTKVRSNGAVVRLRLSDSHLYASYYFADANCRRLPYSELSNASTTAEWKTLGMQNVGTDTFRGGVKMAFSQGIDICGDVIYICTAGPNKSTDGGSTWQRKSGGFSGILVNHINMDSNGKMVLSRTDGNLVTSNGNYTAGSVPSFIRRTKFSSTVATMSLTDKDNSDRLICWYGNSNTSKDSVGIIVTEDGGETYEDCEYDSNAGKFTSVGFKIEDPKTKNTAVLEYDETDETSQTIYASCGTSYDNGENWTANDYFYLDIDGDRILARDIYGDSPTYDLMYSDQKGAEGSWKSVYAMGTLSDGDINAFFDSEDSDIIWYRTTNDFGKINISAKKKTSLVSKTDYDCFSNLAQNPKVPNHLLLTGKALYAGYCPTLYESYDHGASWHVVPGFFGRRTIDGTITFSTTTNEAFIGSHNGILVYEYDNFNYWQGLKLRCKGEEKLLTVEKTSGGKITLPQFSDYFTTSDLWSFNGWEYNGTLYDEGAEITITN